MKEKAEIISLLKAKRPEIIDRYHITKIGIFGSVAHDQAGSESDIDIIVDFNDEASLLDHSGLMIFLMMKRH